MSAIPNPIIRFTVDAPGVSTAMQSAMGQVRQQARTTTQQVADDWKRMAAQIRASAAQGAMSVGEEAKLRQGVLTILDKEISALRTRNELNTKELASLKAMTLERERQASFLKGTGGLTTGTANALNQVSVQTVLGVTRTLDALVNRYLGGAAGSAFRTVRDVAYYGSLAGSTSATGAAGVEGGQAAAATGMLGGLKNALGSVVSTVGEGTIVVTGFVAALTAMAAAATKITVDLADQNQQIENTAAVTGLSSTNVQILAEASRQLGLDSNTVTMSIARFQSQLGEYIRKGQGANDETDRFVASMKRLGVAVEENGKLRDPLSILEDFSDALRAIPDAATRSAIGLDALGTRGRELLPILISNRGSLRDFIGEIQKDGPIIGDEMAGQLDKFKTSWDLLTESIRKNALAFREWVASGFVSALGLDIGGAPTKQQLLNQQIQRMEKNAKLPPAGTTIFLGTPADNEALIKQAAAQRAGGKTQYELLQAEKNYAQAVKDDNGVLAKQYADQIDQLQQIIKLTQSREQIQKRIFDEVLTRGPSGHPTAVPKTADEVIAQIMNPLSAPNIPIPTPIGVSNLAGILGPAQLPQVIKDQMKQVNQDLYNDTASTTQKLEDEFNKQFEYWQTIEDLYPQYAAQISDTIVALKKDEAEKIGNIQKQELEKYKSQADSLFQDLISGKTRDFSRTFAKDIQNILLKPAEDSFDSTIGALFGSLANGVSSTASRRGSSPAAGASTSSGGILSRIWGSVFSPTTPPFFGANGFTGSGKDSAGQFSVATMPVTAGTVNVGSGNGPAGATAGGSGASSTTSFLVSSFASIGKNLENLKGLKSLGLSGTATGAALGGAGLIGGGLLMGIGARQGGALGGLEGAAGGALSGFMVGGPIGAIIGGIGGLISGILGGPTYGEKVQRQMWKQADYLPPSQTFSFASNGSIASTLGTGFSTSGSSVGMFGLPTNTPFYANPIKGPLNLAQTLLLQQQTALMGGNQPFGGFNTNPYAGQGPLNFGNPTAATAPTVNFHIQAIDAQGVAQFLQTNRDAISRTVASSVMSSSSGFGLAVRRAVNMP